MGDARQQLLPALLVPAGALHRFLQPGGHFVKRAAHRRKLVLPGIGDPEVQIALPDAADAGSQQVQRLLHPVEHKAGEKAVRRQNGEHDGQQDQQGRQCDRRLDLFAGVLPRRAEQSQLHGAPLIRQAGQIDPTVPGADLHGIAVQAFRALQQPGVIRLLCAEGVDRPAVLRQHQPHSAAVQQRNDLPDLPAAAVRRGLLEHFPAGPADPGQLTALLVSQPGALPQDGNHHHHTEQARQGRHKGRHHNHQNIGEKQTSFDGHVSRLLSTPDIIAHVFSGFLNCG